MKPFDRITPYNKLPPLPPKADLDTKPILRKTITAARVLAQLNGMLRSMPNPNIFLDTIYLQEAKASSEVENIVTTNDELYQSMAVERKLENPAAKEVFNYKEALWRGMKYMQQRPFITTNLCIEIVQGIRQNGASIRNTDGTTLKNFTGEVIYTPPSGEDVIREKLAQWERFVNDDSGADPLIKMALMHYQFEAIHPFADGNGRTGRILLLLYLKMKRLLDTPAIYLSQYIVENKAEYYRCLCGVTECARWEDYILYMLAMVESTAQRSLERLEQLSQIIDDTANEIKQRLPKVYSKELLEILFRLPYSKRRHLIDAGLGNAKTAGNYLAELEANGLLKSVRVGKEKLYLNQRLMNVLVNN